MSELHAAEVNIKESRVEPSPPSSRCNSSAAPVQASSGCRSSIKPEEPGIRVVASINIEALPKGGRGAGTGVQDRRPAEVVAVAAMFERGLSQGGVWKKRL